MISLPTGSVRSMFLRLCVRAPRTTIWASVGPSTGVSDMLGVTTLLPRIRWRLEPPIVAQGRSRRNRSTTELIRYRSAVPRRYAAQAPASAAASAASFLNEDDAHRLAVRGVGANLIRA